MVATVGWWAEFGAGAHAYDTVRCRGNQRCVCVREPTFVMIEVWLFIVIWLRMNQVTELDIVLFIF